MKILNAKHYRNRNDIPQPWVYVGREFAGFRASPLGNPFTSSQHGSQAVPKYAEWLRAKVEAGDQPVISALASLTDDTHLVCWCVDEHGVGDCHARVVSEVWKGLNPRKTRTSISRIETFAACPRYDYYQVVERIPTPQSEYQDEGLVIHGIVESQFSLDPTEKKPLLGAAVKAMRYYPLPGQPGIEIERKFDGAPYAGALLFAKIDCYTPPGTVFGDAVRGPKKDLHRIIDLKTTKSRNVRYREDPALLDTNRQLLAYVRVRRPDDPLVEVSQVVVGRDAPHLACGPVRIVSQQMAVDQEGFDSEVVTRMVASRKAPSALDLPPAGIDKCENWYGKRCDFYDRCYGGGKISVSGEDTPMDTRSWSDILTAADQDGRGGEGTRSALDLAVKDAVASSAEPKDVVGEFTGSYWFLSNFYPTPGSPSWQTAEHQYQAAKCVRPEDAARILACATPADARRLGKSSRIQIRGDWDAVKVDVMTRIVREKFSDPDLRGRLLATGSVELVEGNNWGDDFWGVDVRTGRGRNELGKILMKVREEIRAGSEPTQPQHDDRGDSMSLINPPDANRNHTNRALEFEGPVQVVTDTLQGKPYTSIIGERHGLPWEFRACLDDWKFLVGGEVYTATKNGKEIKKIRDGILRSTGTVTMSAGGIQYIDQIRTNALHPLLRAWDQEVSPPAAEATSDEVGAGEPKPDQRDTHDDLLSEIEAQQSVDSSVSAGMDVQSETAKLVSSGCTEYQAGRMVSAGITDARLREGSVTQQELEALPKFGPGKAEAILSRYGKAKSETSPAPQVVPEKKTIVDAALESGKMVIVRVGGDGEADLSKKENAVESKLSEVGVRSEDLDSLLAAGITYDRLKSGLVTPQELISAVGAERAKYILCLVEDDSVRTVPATTTATPPSSGHANANEKSYVLYIDCAPTRGDEHARTLERVLRPYLDKIASDRGVPDVLCLPGYEWPGLLVEGLYATPPSDDEAVIVRSLTKEWDAVRRFFLDRASVVIQGTR